MSISEIVIGGISSFIGTASAIYIIPYFTQKRARLLDFEEKLVELDFIKDQVLHNYKISYYEKGWEGWTQSDIDSLQKNYIEVEEIFTAIVKNRYKLRDGLYGRYGKAIKDVIDKLIESHFMEKRAMDAMIKYFMFDGCDPDMFYNHNYDYIVGQGKISRDCLERISELRESIWYKKYFKKLMNFIC